MTFRTHASRIDRPRIVQHHAAILATCLLTLLAVPASAQSYRHRINRPVVQYRHASTVAQGHLDGRANVYRSIGDVRHQTALAARHTQAAYQHKIENRLLRIESYYQAKQTRREYLDQHSSAKVTRDLTDRIRQTALRYRLGQHQYDRFRGTIIWPDPLLATEFDMQRQRLEELFAPTSVTQLGKGTSKTAQVDRTIQEMLEILGQDVRDGGVSCHEFTIASRFLTGLRWEGHFPSHQVALTQK